MSYPHPVQAMPQHRMHTVEEDTGSLLPQPQQLRYLVAYPEGAPVGQGAAIEVQQLAGYRD